jgi:hypothetical protein
MATLTISLSDGVYSVSSDPVKVPEGGKLSIVVPTAPPSAASYALTMTSEARGPMYSPATRIST